MIADLLRSKDEGYQTPEGWDYVRKNKNKFLIEQEEDLMYQHQAAAKCIGPCFTAMDTAVVNTGESECMTNCISKSNETKSLFLYLKLGGKN